MDMNACRLINIQNGPLEPCVSRIYTATSIHDDYTYLRDFLKSYQMRYYRFVASGSLIDAGSCVYLHGRVRTSVGDVL